MEFDLTILGQAITFLLLVLVTMRYIWPNIDKMLEKRKKIIVDGLNAAKEGQNKLIDADKEIMRQFKEANDKSHEIITHAKEYANSIITKAKQDASVEADKIISTAHDKVEKEILTVKEQLRSEMSDIVILALQKVLLQNNNEVNSSLVDTVIREHKW